MRKSRISLLFGAIAGIVMVLLLTGAQCAPSLTGPLPWAAPTAPSEPNQAWEDITGWTWTELEDYVGEVASGLGAGLPEAGGAAGLPVEGAVLPDGRKVLCSNPLTGVYVVEVGPLPPPPAPWTTETETIIPIGAASSVERVDDPAEAPPPALAGGDTDVAAPDQNNVTC